MNDAVNSENLRQNVFQVPNETTMSTNHSRRPICGTSNDIIHGNFLFLKEIFHDFVDRFTFCISHRRSSKKHFFNHYFFMNKADISKEQSFVTWQCGFVNLERKFRCYKYTAQGDYNTIFLFLIHFFLLECIFCGIQNLISIFLSCAQFCDLNNSVVFLPSVSKPKLAIFVTWLNICYERLVYLFRSII